MIDLGCATNATPDQVLTFVPPGHHTITSSALANYGSEGCPNQYLVEFELPTRSGLYFSGTWGGLAPRPACDYTATMTAFGLPTGTSSWEVVDQVRIHGVLKSGVCTNEVDSRLNAMPSDADPTAPYGYVNPDWYERARVAVRATDSTGANAAVLIDYFYPTP